MKTTGGAWLINTASFNSIHKKYMTKAIARAKKASDIGEVPIGAVIVYQDKIIATGYNKREKKQSATAHAEIEAIEKACKKLENWRLSECSLYVTLEPCPMCMGAILNARIDNLYFGAYDKRAGCAGSVTDMNMLDINHKVNIISGVMEDECSFMLKSFFKGLRSRNTMNKKQDVNATNR